MSRTHTTTIGLAEAAARLRLPYQDTHRLMLIGRLRGRKERGRWLVALADVERLARDAQGAEHDGAQPAA